MPPTVPGQTPQALGPTAAQNLLFALSDLRTTQNNLMSVWLNYLADRMRLYRELGVMRLDAEGLWVDESLEDALRGAASNVPLPPELPRDWLSLGGTIARSSPVPRQAVGVLPALRLRGENTPVPIESETHDE